MPPRVRGRQRGFTLTELAVVVAILALILGGVVMTMAAMTNAREVEQTQQQLAQVREAVIGFALRFDRLPCPAAGGTTGVEAFVNTGPGLPIDLSCAAPFNGFVPALTLGIGPTDAQGYLIDAWGNRIRYAVSQWRSGAAIPANCPPVGASPPNNPGPLNFANCPAFTTTGAMKGLGFAALPGTLPVPAGHLRVCDAAACTGLEFMTPAVIFSPGKNFRIQTDAGAAGGVDEEANAHFIAVLDGTFVAHEPRPAGAITGGEFDDLLIWISPNILYNRLIAAGAI